MARLFRHFAWNADRLSLARNAALPHHRAAVALRACHEPSYSWALDGLHPTRAKAWAAPTIKS